MGSPRVGSNPTGVVCLAHAGLLVKKGDNQYVLRPGKAGSSLFAALAVGPRAGNGKCDVQARLAQVQARGLMWLFSKRSAQDTLAERLRRRPAKPMGSPRVGSNPTGVALCRHSCHTHISMFLLSPKLVLLAPVAVP